MAIKYQEVAMYVRKATMSSIRVSYRSVRAHPYISGILFFSLLLSRAFPLLFSFLVSSSPVIVCTAILLGTLLSYGTPNIHEIEGNKTQKISSMQTESAVDDIFVKKDESFTVETHLETGKEAAAASGASNSASDEIVRDASFSKMYDEGYGSDNTILTSSLLHGERKEMRSEIKVIREFSVNDQNEAEGLTIQITKIASDSPFDSALGSPWQSIDNIDPSPGSDSDGVESSSSDASMDDIRPMLNELDPLLKFEHPCASLSSNANSDSSSSRSSEDHELVEVENKETEIKESHGKDDSNEVAVAWNENDQNNVMDLGYSEIERNRRLENLIARRRLRKLQRYETDKNLIDLDSLYPTSIPSISAPRRNPFDLPYDYDGNLNLPPIPGSAPSVMEPRKNPFDLLYDQVEEISTMSREYLSHHDFVSAVQRDVLSQWHEFSTVGPSLLGDFSQENEDSKLIEPELHQGRIMLISPVSHNAEHVERDKQSSWATVSVDNDHTVDFNTSVSFEETDRSAISLGVMEGEIGDVVNNLPVSDARKLEVGEERHEDSSSSSSSEADEKISRVNSYEQSSHLEETSRDSMLSKPVDDAPAVNPVYYSNLSAMEKTISNISTHNEAFIYDCTENVVSNYLPSDVQADFVQVALPQRPFEADVSLADQDLVAVISEGEELALGIVEMPESSGDILPIAAMPESEAGQIMHSSCSSSMDSESNEDCMVDVDKSIQSEGNEMINKLPSVDESAIHLLPKAHIEDSRVSSLDLLSTAEENLEDHKSVIRSPTSSDSTASQVVEESNAHMLDVEQETSICQKAAEEIGHDDLAIELVPEENTGGALVENPIIQTHDDQFIGSESTESREFSNISDVKLKHVTGTINDSSESQRTITHDIFSKNDGGFLKKLSNSGEELDGEVLAEVSRLSDIDEGLLSELDVVGDFRAQTELKADQDGSNQEMRQLATIVEDSCAESQVSGVSPMKYDGIHLGEDAELTVYNSKLYVLEACSLEELDSVFKQHHDESAVPSASDLTINSSVTTESEMELRELDIGNKNQEIIESDTDLLVLEAKSVEDINAALKQLSEGLDKPGISEVETLEVPPEMTHLEVEETISDSHVVEVKSLEDINLALKQPSEVTVQCHQGETKHENVHTEIEACSTEFEPKVVEEQSSEASERNLEPEHVEVISAEEIKFDSAERSSEKSDGNENVANVSSASTSRKVHKKISGHFDSSSSSSSSSSDSE